MTFKILSVVIPVFNNFAFTDICLKDLDNLPEDHEIIIIDNGSTDKTQSALSKKTNIIYHRNDSNLGFAAANNIGYKLSSGENVMFLNNDIKVKKNFTGWTDPIISSSDLGYLVGPTGGVFNSNLYFIRETDKLFPKYFYMCGWNLTASKKLWNKLKLTEYDGPWSEEFGKAYFEDVDLSWRALEIGIKFKIVDVPVKHIGRMTGKLLSNDTYSNARNIFISKWQERVKNLPLAC